MKSVTIYTTPTCGFCKATKAFLAEHEVAYTEHDVTEDESALKEMMDLSGQQGVPFIIVGEGEGRVMITGFDQPKLAAALELS